MPRVLTLYEPATPDQALKLSTAIAAELPTSMFREPNQIDIGGVDPVTLGHELSEYVDEDVAEFVQEALLLSVDELAGVEEVLVDSDGTTFLAELYLLGTASVQTAGVDNWGDTQYDEFTVPNVLIRLRAEIGLADGRLQRLMGDGDVAVFARQEAARRLQNGLLWANAGLEVVPGLDLDEFPVPDGGRRTATVNGHDVQLMCAVEEKRWDLTAQVDGDVVAVLSCAPTRGRRRLRGLDAFEFLLQPEVPHANPPWQFSAMLLEALGRDLRAAPLLCDK